ncbi:hypothetical protein [Microbacterium paludicola]|uniref:hypothetical protein n=1 Tax=Microbacterium paludicola TaxID=300019 RepID=UPI000903F623|nr:hypothetical protein [Microbacterium paludicola]APF35172.1 hypothetical protein BO218_13975 [Microbacterium paludicola]
MPRRPDPLPEALGGAFSCADAAAAGVSRKRLRAADLDTPFRGVRRRRGAEDAAAAGPLAEDQAIRHRVLEDARAYASIMGGRAFFCGRTAAVLWGTGAHSPGELEVGVLAPERAPRRRGIRGRQLAPTHVEVTTLDGLRVSSPASTWAMLGRNAGMRELVRIGDAFVRVPRGERGRRRSEARLCTLDDLAAAVAAGRRVGSAKLVEALGLIREGAMSPLETDFRLGLVAAGLPEPLLDQEIRDGSGRLAGIADAVWPEYRVIAEVEGDHHRTSRSQWARDIEKHTAYVALGFEVVRLTSAHIRPTGSAAVALVAGALRRRGWSPSPTRT